MRNSSNQDSMVTGLDSDDSEMQDVLKELDTVTDPTDREFLLVRLAEYAGRFHDFSDVEISDEFHDQFEALREAQSQYHQTAVRVGRFVARMIEQDQLMLGISVSDDDGSNPAAN